MDVFVYGTLKRGFENNGIMTGATYQSPATTVPGYELHGLMLYPIMVPSTQSRVVHGEVWHVPLQILKRIDNFEGVNAGLFVRSKVHLQGGGVADAYMYNRNFQPNLLESGVYSREAH
jgi:gamma-glutamylaminecyclotransferase